MIVSMIWCHLFMFVPLLIWMKGHCTRRTWTGQHNVIQQLRTTWWLLVATWHIGRWRHVFILQMTRNTFIDIPHQWDLCLTMFNYLHYDWWKFLFRKHVYLAGHHFDGWTDYERIFNTMAIMATYTHCLVGTLLVISDFKRKSEMDISDLTISDLTSATLSKSEM